MSILVVKLLDCGHVSVVLTLNKISDMGSKRGFQVRNYCLVCQYAKGLSWVFV